MMVAQEIAGLLGETTAETKTTLTKLCHSLLEDGSDPLYGTGEEDGPEPANVHLGSGAVPLQGVMTPKEEKPATGYVHMGTVNPAKTSYVHLGNKPCGGGGK